MNAKFKNLKCLQKGLEEDTHHGPLKKIRMQTFVHQVPKWSQHGRGHASEHPPSTILKGPNSFFHKINIKIIQTHTNMILRGLAIITTLTLSLSLSQVLAADQQPLFEKKRSNVSFNKAPPMMMSLIHSYYHRTSDE